MRTFEMTGFAWIAAAVSLRHAHEVFWVGHGRVGSASWGILAIMLPSGTVEWFHRLYLFMSGHWNRHFKVHVPVLKLVLAADTSRHLIWRLGKIAP